MGRSRGNFHAEEDPSQRFDFFFFKFRFFHIYPQLCAGYVLVFQIDEMVLLIVFDNASVLLGLKLVSLLV